MKQKFIGLLLTLLVIGQPVMALAQEINPAFNPNLLIEDRVFSDTQTFGGPEGIQKFLEVKNSVLANKSPEFLLKLKEPTITILKEGLEDPRPNLGRLRTAAELIWDASLQSGLNPQVILVTLNKEQSLITGHQDSSPEKLQRALDFSMGFACPDSTGCSQNTIFPGFYFQLFGNFDASGNRYLGAAKSLMRSFNASAGRGPVYNGKISTVGETIVLPNTTGGPFNPPESSTITLANKATTALYRFTPHVFNGNYNFWRFFNEWFRFPNGTLIKLASGPEVYIIQNGTKQLVPAFVAQARGLDVAGTLIASPTEFETYPTDKILGPGDNTVVKITGDPQTFVFLGNVKRPASSFVLSQRQLDSTPVLTITPAEAQLFEQGAVLPPSEGTVVRGVTAPEIYLVDGGVLKLFSAFTFSQHKASNKVQLIPDSEISTYPKQGFVAPLNGTIIKGSKSQGVYEVQGGLKRPFSGAVFKTRGITAKAITVLSEDEVAGIATGPSATPGNRTFFTVEGTGQLYIFKEGAKHFISPYVAKQRGITGDFVVSQTEANSWQDGIAIPPRDGTIVKGDGSQTVYLVSKGQLRPLTATAFKRRGITAKKIVTLSQAEINSFAIGDVLEK